MIESPRGRAIQRTLAQVFEALKEHSKLEPVEVAEIYEAVAAHIRSTAPKALGGSP